MQAGGWKLPHGQCQALDSDAAAVCMMYLVVLVVAPRVATTLIPRRENRASIVVMTVYNTASSPLYYI